MMRIPLISAAAAASALALAAPAAAQYYPGPPPPPPGYGQGHGYGQNNYGQFRRLDAQIEQMVRHINQLDRRDVIRNREANRLRAEARDIRRQLHFYARDGLSRRERNEVQYRIGRLEHRVAMVSRDAHRWGQNDRRWNDYWDSADRSWQPNDRRWDRDDDNRGRRGWGDRDDD